MCILGRSVSSRQPVNPPKKSRGSRAQKMKLAIVGSRDMTDMELMIDWINLTVMVFGPIECIISGGARGADTLAERYARMHGIKFIPFRPDWKKYGRKRAGLLRNHDIVGAATHVLAFPSPNGSGTQHSMSLAKKQKKPLVECWLSG